MEVFSCPKCKCKRFWRMRTVELLVDFGQEGAIEGHPKLEGPERDYIKSNFRCAECGFIIAGDMARAMETEVM